MVKHIIVIFLSFFLLSCASRKVVTNKSSILAKVDSTFVAEKQNIITKENHISIITNSDELEIAPIDSTKPIIIDNKAYFNATLRYKKTKVVLVDTSKTKVEQKASIKVSVKKDIKSNEVKKEVEKGTNVFFWIGVIIILIVTTYLYIRDNNQH